MISVFDRNKLKNLLKDFYEITKIRITVFDEERKELVSYPERVANFCEIIRCTETGRIACAKCDREACDKAASQRTTQIYRCHAGLTEAVAPLIVQGVLVGYLIFGHVFDYPDYETGWKRIEEMTKDLPVDQKKLQKAVMEQRIISSSYVSSATQIMSAVASYLVMERMAILQTDKLAVQLDLYIRNHYTEDIKAEVLCEHFRIGKTRLYEICHQIYGCGLAHYIRNLRILKAKELLRSGTATLGEIAEQCGYPDYNYFISVFTREAGISPRKWQMQNSIKFN